MDVLCYVLGGICAIFAIVQIVGLVGYYLYHKTFKHFAGLGPVIWIYIVAPTVLAVILFIMGAQVAAENAKIKTETYPIEVQIVELKRTDTGRPYATFETEDHKGWVYVSDTTYQMLCEGDYVRIIVIECTKDGERCHVTYQFDKIVLK